MRANTRKNWLESMESAMTFTMLFLTLNKCRSVRVADVFSAILMIIVEYVFSIKYTL